MGNACFDDSEKNWENNGKEQIYFVTTKARSYNVFSMDMQTLAELVLDFALQNTFLFVLCQFFSKYFTFGVTV